MPQFIDNGDGTHTQIADNGTRSIVIDPTGSYAAQLNDMSAGQPVGPQGVAAISGGSPAPMAPLRTPIASSPSVAPPPGSNPARTAGPNYVEPAMAATPEPVVVPGSTSPATTTTVTGVHSQGRSGPDAASRARIETAGKGVIAAENKAADTGMAAGGEMAQHHAAEAVNQYMLGKQKEAGAMAAQQTFSTAYDAALKDREQAQKRPIDLKEAFGDDRGAYAFLATMGAAISNVGRAWMGQAMQPITVIDDLINRSIKLQMDRRSQDVQAAGERADVANQRLQIARADAHEGAAQAAEGRMQFAKSQDEMSALAKIRDDQRAKAQAINFDIAKATATQATQQDSTHTVTKTASAAAGPTLAIPGEQGDNVDQRVVHDEIARSLPDLKPQQRIAQWNKYHEKALATERLRQSAHEALSALDAAAPDAAKGHGQSVAGQAWYSPSKGRFASDEANRLHQAVAAVVSNGPLAKGMKRLSKEDIELTTDQIMSGHDYQSIKRGLQNFLGEADEADASLHAESPGLYRLHHYLQGRQHERGLGGAGVAQQQAAVTAGSSGGGEADDSEEPEE